MFSLVIKRFFQLIFVLWGISTAVFFLERAIPGSPADTVLGADASDDEKQHWLSKQGLDKPILQQYESFLIDLTHGSLGKSYASFSEVTDLVLPRFLETAKLAVVAFLFSLLLATVSGVFAALYRDTALDRSISVLSLLAICAPSFLIGPLLIWVFAVKWDIFPLMGNLDAWSYVLPSVTLGASLAAFSSRLIRSGLVDVLHEDYIRTARSKGLSESRIIWGHALRNAFLPVLTVLGMQLGVLLSGTIITEQIFNWPGLGSLLLEAVQQREYNVVSGCVLVVATVYVICNLIVDVLYQVCDPRIRLS